MAERYELRRSRRKTLALEVTREGQVIVRAPLRVSVKQIERFVAAHADWIARAQARQRERLAAHPEPDEKRRAELIRRAKAELPPKVTHYARLMGVQPTGLTITSARTRFGSMRKWRQWAATYHLRPHAVRLVQREKPHLLFLAADGLPRGGGGLCRGARAGAHRAQKPRAAVLGARGALYAGLPRPPRTAARMTTHV